MLPLSTTIHHYPHCQQKPAISWHCWECSATPRRSVCVWTSFGRSTVSLMFPSNNQHLIRMITWACCLTKILNALPPLAVACESQPRPPMFLLSQHWLEARSSTISYHQPGLDCISAYWKPCVFCLLGCEPFKTRSFPNKTSVIWLPNI